MKKFLYGFLFGIIALPAIDSCVELLQVSLEIPKGLLSEKVLKINKRLSTLQVENESVDTCCIGFQAPSVSDIDDEYDE